MKELKSNKNGAINYATMKIYHVLEQQKKRLSEIVVPGSIGYLFFDREKFDKELMRKIYRTFNCRINLDKIYDDVLTKLDLYAQRDFLENMYGYSFRKCGKYRDYGMVIFYKNGFISDWHTFNEFLARWLNCVALSKCKKARKRRDLIECFSKKPFEFDIRWNGVWMAACYFCPGFSEKDAENTIMYLAELKNVRIKEIDKFKIVFA